MPLSWFVISSTIGLPLIAAFALKWATPDSSDHFILSLSDLNRLNPPSFLDASTSERFLNMLITMKKSVCSFAAFLCTVSREVQGKTVPLALWQIGLLALFLPIAGKAGFEMTHHPRFFQGFFAFLKFVEEGSLSYAALSGIVYVATVYQCATRTFCLSDSAQEAFTYVNFLLSLCIALFSATTAYIHFEEEHRHNEKIISAISNAPNAIVTECVTVAHKAQRVAQRCAAFFQAASIASPVRHPSGVDTLPVQPA
jgi:hypothetical protein